MFDGLDYTPDLSVPTLEGLAWLLRHKEKWPHWFVWDFSHCRTCAMGLSYALWRGRNPPEGFQEFVGNYIQDKFNITEDDRQRLFCYLGDSSLGDYDNTITPEHVADAIDAYLAERGV